MAGLVPIGVAMAHVREDGTDRIEIVQGKLDDAEAIVIDYLKKPDHGWTSQTLIVFAATLTVVTPSAEQMTKMLAQVAAIRAGTKAN